MNCKHMGLCYIKFDSHCIESRLCSFTEQWVFVFCSAYFGCFNWSVHALQSDNDPHLTQVCLGRAPKMTVCLRRKGLLFMLNLSLTCTSYDWFGPIGSSCVLCKLETSSAHTGMNPFVKDEISCVQQLKVWEKGVFCLWKMCHFGIF